MFETGSNMPYIEAFVDGKCIGKFVNMHTLNNYIAEHKLQNVQVRFETLRVQSNPSLAFQLMRQYHVR